MTITPIDYITPNDLAEIMQKVKNQTRRSCNLEQRRIIMHGLVKCLATDSLFTIEKHTTKSGILCISTSLAKDFSYITIGVTKSTSRYINNKISLKVDIKHNLSKGG